MPRRIPSELFNRRPTKCALKVAGKTVTRWPVLISVSSLLKREATVVEVLAPSASEAAHLVQDEFSASLWAPFEVTVVGARGGVAAYLFTGHEQLIGLKMINARH